MDAGSGPAAFILSSGLRQSDRMAIRRGLVEEEFFLTYQPIFEIGSSGRIVTGAEALLRWQHPDMGLLRPSRFMRAVELAHLKNDLGAYVLQTALKQVRSWLDTAGWSPRVSVNMATHEFDNSLGDRVLAALELSKVSPSYLTVEILESPVIPDTAMAASQFELLRKKGVNVAIDDFGMGSASFQYLLRFPFDSIKICAEFVNGIGQDTGADQLCQAIIQLGRSLGKRIIAEGVETERQLEFLRMHHCHEIQGFLVGHPVEGSAFMQLFAEWLPERS